MLFINPVSLVENPKINEWLTMVEKEMRLTLATFLAQSAKDIKSFSGTSIDPVAYISWVDKYQAQLIVLSSQIVWSENCEVALQSCDNGNMNPLQAILEIVEATLTVLADSVLQEQPPVRRIKLEHLVICCDFFYLAS